MADLAGRVALITGGANGMGLASAKALATRGAAVIIADLDGDAAGRAANEIRKAGGEAHDHQLDASSLPELKVLFEKIAASHGRLNFFFSNVGIRCASGYDVTEAQFDEALSVNLKSHYFATLYALPLMRPCAPAASIVYMSSGSALRGQGRSSLYSISKAALVMMMRSFTHHLGPEGIRVNALCPGSVNTAFPLDGKPRGVEHEAMIVERGKEIPLGRVAEPEDIAGVVSFLATDESTYLTGVAIPIDGGVLA